MAVIARIMGLDIEDPAEIRERSSVVANAMAMKVALEYYVHALAMLQELSDLIRQTFKRRPDDPLTT